MCWETEHLPFQQMLSITIIRVQERKALRRESETLTWTLSSPTASVFDQLHGNHCDRPGELNEVMSEDMRLNGTQSCKCKGLVIIFTIPD